MVMLRLTLLLLVLCWAVNASAGQVTLSNGDILQGALKGIEGDVIVWQSASLGEVRLPKAAIQSLESSEPMKIQGKDVPCFLAKAERQRATFTCVDGDRKTFSLLSIKDIVGFRGDGLSHHVFAGKIRASGLKHAGTLDSEFWEILSTMESRRNDIRNKLLLSSGSRSSESSPGVFTRTRRLQATYGLDWFFAPQWFWANQLTYGQDDAFNIREEYALNSGLGYQFWETDASALSFELGLQQSMQYLQVVSSGDNPLEYTSVRLVSDYRHRYRTGINFYQNNEYTQSLESPNAGNEDRWIIVSNSGVSFPIGFGVSADIGLEWKYVNHARDLDPNASMSEATYRFGVNYTW